MGEEAVAEIMKDGGEASFFQADFESSQAVRDTVHYTLQKYKRIDVLVNNAMSRLIPWGDGKTAVETSEEEWDKVLAVGLKAPFIACQEVIPEMIRHGGGSIINIGSVRSLRPGPKGITYDVVKSGLINLSSQLNIDFGSQGIRSNLICPGLIFVTPGYADEVGKDPVLRGQVQLSQTIKRPGLPIDIAKAALFLASEDSSFMAGSVLVVDGGNLILSGRQFDPKLEKQVNELYAAHAELNT
jgi:NAD(P)-dependent dehydrogenase (short-subunit alcohol dehydrogenase family)